MFRSQMPDVNESVSRASNIIGGVMRPWGRKRGSGPPQGCEIYPLSSLLYARCLARDRRFRKHLDTPEWGFQSALPLESRFRTSPGPVCACPVAVAVSMGRRNTKLEPTLH
jgi:hypothetical protein